MKKKTENKKALREMNATACKTCQCFRTKGEALPVIAAMPTPTLSSEGVKKLNRANEMSLYMSLILLKNPEPMLGAMVMPSVLSYLNDDLTAINAELEKIGVVRN